jgi:hypothetical protein
MFSYTQILLLVITFLVLGAAVYAFIVYTGKKKELLVHISLIVLFVIIVVGGGFTLYYLTALVSLFGWAGFILLGSVLVIILLALINLWVRADLKEKLKKLKI